MPLSLSLSFSQQVMVTFQITEIQKIDNIIIINDGCEFTFLKRSSSWWSAVLRAISPTLLTSSFSSASVSVCGIDKAFNIFSTFDYF